MNQPADPRRQFADQIARLQKRQLELVQQTSAELEALKEEVERSESFDERIAQETKPLLKELSELRSIVDELQSERAHHQEGVALLQMAVESLRGGTHAQRALPAPQATFERIEPAPAVKPSKKEKERKPEPIIVAKAPKEPRPARIKIRFPKRLARIAVFIALLGFGANYAKNHLVGSSVPENGQVAGVSTSAPTAPTSAGTQSSDATMDYKESFADLPFDQTVWDKSIDTDFGVTIEYPKNTSNRIHTVGSSNLWFLRKNGYLVKITRTETDQTLAAFVDASKEDGIQLDLQTTTFKGLPAVLAKDASAAPSSGYSYFVKNKGVVYEIWIKQEPIDSDDGQRIARMVSSLQFAP